MNARLRYCAFVVVVLLSFVTARQWPLVQAAQAASVFTVSAASYEPAVTPDSIATAFGAQLATTTAIGGDTDPNTPGVQLPTTLGGTFVEVNGLRAGLFFVSPTQVNLLIPAGVAAGTATVRVTAGNGVISTGTVTVNAVSPAIFTANADGRGVPAAVLLRIRQGGAQSFETLSALDTRTGRLVTKPIDLGSEGDQVYAILFATGARRAPDTNNDGNVNESVHVLIAGNEVTPQFAGRSSDLAGLDQINVLIPRSLLGRGKISLSLNAPSAPASNVVELEIAGGPSLAPPQLTGLGSGAALAGQVVTLTGSGFAATPGDNLVRIGDLETQVTSATNTALTVVIPFGAETAPITVRTPLGETRSSNPLQLRTSVSGLIETTSRQPLANVTVQVTSLANGQRVTTKTGPNGVFVAADAPLGGAFIKVIGSSLTTAPMLETLTLPVTIITNRDNPYIQTVYLQPINGASAQVGGQAGAANLLLNAEPTALSVPVFAPFSELVGELTAQQNPTRIQTGNVTFELPGNAAVLFPDGTTRGRITLSQYESSRLPVRFPEGVFSSTVVQLSPLGTRFNPGGKLTFPNPDGFAANAQLKLFKLDQNEHSNTLGQFLDLGTATVSGDGRTIETAPNAITEAAIYFVALARQTTTVNGRALDADRTPVRHALIRARGQEQYTDGNGGFILPSVPVFPGNDLLSIEASLLRPNGRVERLARTGIAVVKDGVTNIVPDLIFGAATANQPPVLFAQNTFTANAGQTNDLPVFASDPDSEQPVNVTVTGASFATIIRNAATPQLFTLRLTPAIADAGSRDLTLTATDVQNAATAQTLRLTVVIPNRPPTALDQRVATDEDTPKPITLGATDPDNSPLTWMIVAAPTKGVLTGTPPNVTYTPNKDYNGPDSFTFKVNDGEFDSNTATVNIAVNPVNDAPVLTVPGAQTVKEGETLSFTVSATDVDAGDVLTFSAPTIPSGANFNAATRTFTWTPSFSQAGTFTATFAVMDNGTPPKSDSKTVQITVTDVNRPPTATAQQVATDEDKAIAITLAGSDPDNDPLTFMIVTSPTKGALSGTAPNLTYTPNKDYNGPDSIVFKVNDGKVDSASATVSITVRPINDAPVANAQQVTLDEDTTKNIVLTASDVDGDALTYAIVAQPTHGTLTGTAPNLSYKPAQDYNGPDSFTFKANDGKVDSNTATVSITVRPATDLPRGNTQTVTTDEDTPKQFTLTGVDPDGGTLRFMILTQPRNGILTGTLPTLTYTPRINFNGMDSFTFKVTNATGDSPAVTVNITVNGVNDPPVLSVPGPQTVAEGQNLTFTVSATDPDSTNIKITAPTRPTGANFVESQRTFSWTPGFDQAGTYTVTFTAMDDFNPPAFDTKTVTITVTNTNRAPSADAKTVTTNEDTAAPVVLTGADPDGDKLTFAVVTQPQKGKLAGTAPNLTYTPNQDVNGTDSFTFKTNDGVLDSPLALVTINITPVNDAPVLNVPGAQTANEGTTLSFNLTATDVDTGQTLTFSSNNLPQGATLSTAGAFSWKPGNKQAGVYTVNFTVTDNGTPVLSNTKTVQITVVNPPPVASAQTVTTDEDTPKAIVLGVNDPDGDALTYTIVNAPQHGTLSGTAPNLTYTPALNYNGADSFTFKANDGTADSNTATVSITINPVNDAPVINVPPQQTVNENATLNFTVTASDIDANQTLTLSAANVPQGATFTAATGVFTWTPSFAQAGDYTVNFTVTDNGTPVLSNTKSVLIRVVNVNRAPTANAQTVATDEDTPKAITLTGSDPDGDTLTFAIVAPPTKGALTGTAPNLTYTPQLNVNGGDTFTFKVSDGGNESSVVTVTINITPVNDAPVITVPPAQTVAEGAALNFTVTAADVDAGQTLTLSATNVPQGATFTAATGAFAWTPGFNQAGTYTVTFAVTDNGTPPLTNSKTVQITVTDLNRPPTANGQQLMTDEDAPLNITLAGSDPDNDTLQFILVTNPNNGVLTGTVPNLIYTPRVNYGGPDSFTFRVNDGKADSNTATISITVKPVNDAPTATAQSVQVTEDTPKQITLAGTDVEGSTLTFMVVTQPMKGVLSGTAPNLTYTPNANATGTDMFTFKVNDGVLDSTPATVGITIGAVNDPPVANAQQITADEDTNKAITLTATDADNDPLTFTIVTPPAHGALNGSAPNLVYLPNSNYNGPDSFTFKANDGKVDSNVATVTITINALNDPPVVTVPGAQMVDEGAQLQFTVTASDVDTGQTLTLSAPNLPSGASFTAQTGLFSWTPNFSQAGVYTLNFTATDNGNPVLTDTKSVVITVKDAVRTPVANGQAVTTDEDTSKPITLSGSDPDNLSLTFMIVGQPQHGTLTGTPPAVTYVPAANYNGADAFTFKVNNGKLDSSPATVNITINAINDAPTISAPDSRTANEGDAITFTVTGSDVDTGQTLAFSATPLPTGATINATTGAFAWTPAFNQSGSYSITFKVTDSGNPPLSATKTTTFTINDLNRPPVANSFPVTLNEDTPTPVTLTGSDPDGETITFAVVTPPAHGTLTGTAPNLTYTPALNYNGSDTFTYKTNDGKVDSVNALVTLTITPVNDAPVITVPGTQSVSTGQNVNFTVTAADVDAGQTLTLSAANVPNGATFTAATGVFNWTPGVTGTFTVSFTATDNGMPPLSDTKTVQINVGQTNRPPSCTAVQTSTSEDTPKTFALTCTDPDNNPLTYTVVTQPQSGQVSLSGASATYTPNLNFNGQDSFTFKANDGSADSAAATATITVTPVCDPPVLSVPGAQTVAIGEQLTFNVTASDPDSPTLTLTATNVPSGASFTPSGNTGTFTWTPAVGTAPGDYTVTFRATDDCTPTALADSKTVTITVSASPREWEQLTGPEGGKVLAMASISGNVNNVFAALQGGGIFRSSDNGGTWTAVNNGLTNLNVTSLVAQGTVLYAGTQGDGVFRSVDQGGAWSPFNTGLTELFIGQLAANGSNLFATTASTLFNAQTVRRTPLNEAAWTAFNTGLDPQGFSDLQLAGTKLFASTLTLGVYASDATTANWTAFNNGFGDAPPFIYALTASDTALFAGTDTGVFTTPLASAAWTTFSTGLDANDNVRALEVLGTTLYARTDRTVFVPQVSTLYNVVKTPLVRANWTQINTGITNRAANAFAQLGTNVFAGTDGSGVYRTADAGANWAQVNSGLRGALILSLFVKDTLIFAGLDGGGIFVSSNDGASWTAANNGLTGLLPFGVNAFATDGTALYAGTNSSGVYRSTDNGANWSSFNDAGFNNTPVKDLVLSNSKIFAATGDTGLYSSPTNTAATWTSVNVNGFALEATALFKTASNLFLGTGSGTLYRSDLNGATWSQIGSGLDSSVPLTSFALRGASNFFTGRNGDGTWRSTTNGDTFTRLVSGLTNQNVTGLRSADTRLYATTNGGGVYVTVDDGATWKQIITGLTNLRVRAVVIKGTTLFVGTEGSGVFMRPVKD